MHALRRLDWTRHALPLGFAASLAWLAACAGTGNSQKLVAPEGLTVGMRYHAGGIIAGPQPVAPDEAVFQPSEALALTCEVLYVEEIPLEGLEPLDTLASFVASVEQGEPIVPHAAVLSASGLAQGPAARIMRGALAAGDYGESLSLSTRQGALPYGVSALIYAQAVERGRALEDDPGSELASNQLGMFVARKGKDDAPTIELALALRDATTHDETIDEDPSIELTPGQAADRNAIHHEIVLLKGIPFERSLATALVVPSPFQSSRGKAFVVFLDVREPPPEAKDSADWRRHSVAAEEAREEVLASVQAVQNAQHVEREDVAVLALISAVLDAQRVGSVDEQALFGLAHTLGATIGADLLLVGDEPMVDDLVRHVLEQKALDEEGLDSRAAYRWLIDRCTWIVLAERMLEGEGDLIVDSIALRHGGELGRAPATILEGIENVSDSAAFDRFIVQENLSYLRDSQPAARVRAYEWLKLRGKLPADYEPMADIEDRRKALNAFYEMLREEVREGSKEIIGS